MRFSLPCPDAATAMPRAAQTQRILRLDMSECSTFTNRWYAGHEPAASHQRPIATRQRWRALAKRSTAEYTRTLSVRGAFVSINPVMHQRVTRSSFLAALFLVSVGSFAPFPSHAAVTGTWSDGASRDQSFSRVLVVGISPDLN